MNSNLAPIMPISIWQRKHITWLSVMRTSILTPDFDDWDNFFVEFRNGYIQMADATLDASGDSLQSFDPHDTISIRAERGAAWLDRHDILVAARQRRNYIHKGRRSKARGDTYKTNPNPSQKEQQRRQYQRKWYAANRAKKESTKHASINPPNTLEILSHLIKE